MSIETNITPVIIDKITITRDIEDEKLALPISQTLWDMMKSKEMGVVNQYTKSRYETNANIYPVDSKGNIIIDDETGPLPPVFVQVKRGKKPQVRVEYNPSKLDPSFYDQLNMVFTFFDGDLDGASFFNIIADGYVTRIDLATNVEGAKLTDFMFKVKHSQCTSAYYNSDGEPETYYYGKKKGNQITAYDKVKEEQKKSKAKDKKQDDDQEPYFRIECRMRNQGTVRALSTMTNPFERITMYDLTPQKPPKVNQGHWIAFTDSARLKGCVKQAIKTQPKEYRNTLKTTLKHAEYSGWEPDKLWTQNGWETLLDKHHLLHLPEPLDWTMKSTTGV